MKGTFPIDKFRELRTPFYYYDTKVLRDTLTCIRTEASRYDNYSVHYAVKANANSKVLTIIRESGLGADCVSGGEIRAAIKAGFPANKIVFAGVGKADWEINLGLDYDIFCFNVESIPELEIINELAEAKGKIRALVTLGDPKLQVKIFEEILEHGYSVRKVEEIVKSLSEGETVKSGGRKIAPKRAKLPEEFNMLKQQLSGFFSTKVQLTCSEKGKGKISIPFNNEEELERIIGILDTLKK